MKIEIPYDNTRLTAEISENDLCAVLKPQHLQYAGASGDDIVRAAMENPIGSERLKDLARGKARVLVIASDHTRPVPSKVIMPLMLKEIREGNSAAQIIILIATGFHRETTREELIDKFGADIALNEDIRIHDSRNLDNMTNKGTLPSGTQLWINSLADWAELIVSEGFIEPHFFAGFSGGRKSILPGIASKTSVLGNHCSKFIAHPCSRTGVLEGNPIHLDMVDAAKKAGLKYIVNVVLDEDKNIIAAFAGDAVKAHAAGCDMVKEQYVVKKCEADIVITSNGGYPLDQDIYQSVKGMSAAETCVCPGGVIIMCASCKNGHGGEAFYRWFSEAKDAKEIDERIQKIKQDETLPDQWEAQILARILLKASVIVVCRADKKQLVEDMKMQYAPTIEEALKRAYQITDGRRVVVIPDGIGVIIEQ